MRLTDFVRSMPRAVVLEGAVQGLGLSDSPSAVATATGFVLKLFDRGCICMHLPVPRFGVICLSLAQPVLFLLRRR